MPLAQEFSDNEEQIDSPPAHTSFATVPVGTSVAPRHYGEEVRENQDDLLELERSGFSVVLPPPAQQVASPAPLEASPMANVQRDSQEVDDSVTHASSNYAAE